MEQAHSAHNHPAPGSYVASSRSKTIYAVLMFVGVLLFALGLAKDSERTWHSFLTSYFFFVSLAIGGLFFTAIQHVTKAGWSVNIRRFIESLTAFLPIGAVGAIVLLFGAKSLYEWLNPEVMAHDLLLQGKSGYLNLPFFLVRLAIFFGLWLFSNG